MNSPAAEPVKFVVIAGAISAMAQETARILAVRERCDFLLLGRSEEKLQLVAEDLRTRGARNITCWHGDLVNPVFQESILMQMRQLNRKIDLFFIAWGQLGDDRKTQIDIASARHLIEVNFTSTVCLLTLILPVFETQKSGTIAVISSVAGDRGRQSNYVYGSTKAALSAYLQGYRNRLYRSNVHVLTIKPGFIATPMTAHLPRGRLTADAKTTGAAIYSALRRGADIAYVPWFWVVIMSIVKMIPENIFKRLKM